MKYVFADTVGLLARWDTKDQWHSVARMALDRVLRNNSLVLTTSYVLLECGNACARTPFRSIVARVRQELEGKKLLVVPTPDDWKLAWAAYQSGEANNAGIVDHVSFQVMRRLGIDEAFTNDNHFTAAGFKVLF